MDPLEIRGCCMQDSWVLGIAGILVLAGAGYWFKLWRESRSAAIEDYRRRYDDEEVRDWMRGRPFRGMSEDDLLASWPELADTPSKESVRASGTSVTYSGFPREQGLTSHDSRNMGLTVTVLNGRVSSFTKKEFHRNTRPIPLRTPRLLTILIAAGVLLLVGATFGVSRVVLAFLIAGGVAVMIFTLRPRSRRRKKSIMKRMGL